MARILVVFYSRTGRSRTVATAVATRLGAVIEEIDVRGVYRPGMGSYFRGIAASVRREATPIADPKHDPADFDFVVLIGPLWAGTISCPMRGYMDRVPGRIARYAAFITSTEGKPTRAFADLERIIGTAPAATGAITIREDLAGKLSATIEAFARAIEQEIVRQS